MKEIDFNKIKLIILDIDNTLTTSNREITDYTKEIIGMAVEKGIYVVLCSGRTNQYTIEKSKLANASSIVISDNGAIIYDYELKKTYLSYSFKKDTLSKILKLCNLNNLDCVYNTINGEYRYNEHKVNNYINIIKDINDIHEDVTQIVIDSKYREDTKRSFDVISTYDDTQVSNTNIDAKEEKKHYFCDLNVKGVSKGLAIIKLMEILNIKDDEVLCFGDSMNDYTMMYATKYFIAMKNAIDELKAKAYMVTEYDNNHDGVANFINKYILKANKNKIKTR